ncbi:hypothetical protein AGMMS49944_23860 [Spirochaetia bacterium]|nr:hypothetical protein AGMMS49944_23860 [Spirochaetia bacterium]
MKRALDKLFRAIDRAISGTVGRQLLFFAGTAIAVFAVLLGVSSLLYPPEGPFDGRFWTLVINFIDVGGFDETAGVGRVLILITNIFGMVLLTGMLVSVLTNIIERRIDRVKDGEVYYRFKDHVVIIGFDPMCEGLIQSLAEKQTGDIVLQTVREAAGVRHELFSNLNKDAAKRVTIVSGNRTSPEDMDRLRIADCTTVFLLGESGEEDRDSQNIECLTIINGILAPEGKTIRCHVLFDRQATFASFQQQDLPEIREHIDFVPFNFCELWAQKVFVDQSYHGGEVRYLPLDRDPITADSDKKVHLLVLGMTNMGIALALQAAHICHFPNYVTKGIKTTITLIDEHADRELDFLKGRLGSFMDKVNWWYRDIDEGVEDENLSYAVTKEQYQFTDVEFEFIKARFEQEEVQKYLVKLSAKKDTFLTIAAAAAETPAALACGLYLPREVYDSGAQVLIRQSLSYGTIAMLSKHRSETEYRKYKNVKPFGMLQNCYDLERADDLLPMMVKYTYDNTSNESIVKEFPADVIRRNWMENWKAADNVSALKASNRYCANFIPVKQRSLGIQPGVELDEQQIELAARMEHNRWVTEKLLVGFRAPSAEEAAGIAADKKREYYKARLIHEDIKGYGDLGEDDKKIDVKLYDINISRALPYMLREYQGMAQKE